MTLVYTAPQQAPGERYELLNTGQRVATSLVADIAAVGDLQFWVFVELYLAAAGGDLRAAIAAAQAAHPGAGITFVLPGGTYQWVGAPIAPANGTTWLCYGCTIELNQAGVAGGQQFFFLRSETDASHADQIVFKGGRFRFLNVLTSFFSAAIQFEAASNCAIEESWGECTLDAAATQGRIRWGFNLFGGPTAASPAKNNRFSRVRLSVAQIQGCGAGRSADGVEVLDTQVIDANDLAVSVVSSGAAQSLQNVTIRNVQCHNVAGSGVVLAGTDGQGTGIGVGVLRNILVDGVWLDGQRSTPDLTFAFVSAVTVNGGLDTENVVVGNVGTHLAPNASLQARSVIIGSQDDETSWKGLSLHDLDLGGVTTNDPLEALFVAGKTITGVTITNVVVRGVRGIWLQNVDQLVATNLVTLDGSCSVVADRNLAGLQFTGCSFTRVTGFQACLSFTSSSAKNVARCQLTNMVFNGNGVPLTTSLTGGTMQMWLSDIENTSGSNPTAETLAGIIRWKNVRGFIVPLTKTVAVPALGAGVVDYVDVSLAATRMADVAVNEVVVANPTADLAAGGGAGGGYLYPRVKSVGVVRLAFVGPLAAANVDFNFDRTA